ncbi:dienelactone hydrolase family protein [Pendulispora rubella]|uniref:Dienelactone hydrolase family protein n=1 Tax=Pendulispora rubella TaxID=2741070 RepID=A0ABZ2LCF0_9BACT
MAHHRFVSRRRHSSAKDGLWGGASAATPRGAVLVIHENRGLLVYGALDTRVNASRPAAQAALEQAALPHEIVTYDGADHAFFNDTGARYNADAAAKAWTKVLDWFGRYLG